MKKSVFNLGKGKEPHKVIRGGVFAMMLCALVCVAGSCKVGLGDSVDTEAPSVKIVYPDPNTNAIIRDTFILYGECGDDKQITAVKVTLVNKLTGETVLEDAPATVDSSSKHWRIDLNKYSPENRYAGWQLADGTYSATVRAYDGSHDSSSDEKSSASSTFDIDNTPPVFVIKNPGVVKSGSSSPSAYGSIFTIEGTISDLHSVSSMDVTIYDESGNIVSKENYNGEEISSFREDDIASLGEASVSVIIAQAGSARYDGIYGDSSGTQKYTCSIKLTDNAKKYVAPPESADQRTAEEAAADEKGNSTSSLYLYDDVYETLLSQKKDTSKKLQPTDLMNILNGTKSDDEAKQILAGAEKDTSSAEESGRLYFSLNPNANPTYQVNGFEYKFGANATNQQASSGNAVSVTVTQGLDQTQIDLDGNEKSNATVKVWMKEYTAGPESKEELAAELSETLAKKVRALEDDRDGYSDSTFTEYSKATDSLPATEIGGWKLIYDYGKNNSGGASVSTKTFSVTLPEGSIVLNKYYMLAVTGRDIDGVEFSQNTIYGFLGNEAGVPPTLKILSPGSSSLQAATGFSFSGSAVLTGGSLYASYLRATLSVTDQDTNADLGTYTEEISRAGADKGWTSTAAFTCAEDGSWTFSPSGLKDYEKIKAEKNSGKSYLYTLELYGKSSSGHDSSVSQNVQIDSKKPSVGISSITPTVDEYKGETGPFVNGTVTVKGSVEETNLESVVMEVYAGDELKETRDLGKVYSFSQTIDTTALPDEVLLDVRVTATDKVGNTATYSSRSAKDSEYTSLKISQKTDNPVITLNNASIEGFTENAGSIGTEKGNLFGVISNNKISVSVSDDDLIKSVTMKVYNENGEEIASTTPPGEIGKSTYSNSFALPSAEGVYKVEVIATDDILSTELSGEREPKTTSTGKFYVAVSAGAPAITLDSVKTYLTATPSFTGTVSSTQLTVKAEFTKANIDGKDADEKKLSEYNAMLSQPKKGTAKWTVSLIEGKSLDNGKYTVRFTASNDYGESNSSEAEFTVDNEKPTVKITEYNSVKNENGFTEAQKFYLNPTNIKTIKGTCADNESGSGIDSVYYHIGAIETGKETPSTENGWILANLTKTESETGWTISLTDLNVTEGENYPVHIKATDKAGNVSDDNSAITLYIDSTPPVTTLEGTALFDLTGKTVSELKSDGSTYYAKESFSFEGTITEVNLDSIKINGNTVTPAGNKWKYEPTIEKDGTYTYKAVLTDKAGNQSEYSIIVTYDTKSPSVSVTSPAAGDNTKDGKITISGNASDIGSGVKKISYTITEVPVSENPLVITGEKEISESGEWKFEDIEIAEEGKYSLTVNAQDVLGNSGSAPEVEFYYDKTPPSLSASISDKALFTYTKDEKEYSVYSSATFNIEAKASDNVSGVSGVTANSTTTLQKGEAGSYKGTVVASLKPDGTTSISIVASDKYGNAITQTIENIIVDVTPPSLAISSYPENATKDGFTLSGTVSDNLGVESVAVTDSLDSSKSYVAAVSSDGKWSVTLKPTAKGEGANETKDGSHTYTVTAKDKVGNTSTATCRVTTDTTAPYWYTGNTEAKEPYISTKASSEKITVSGVEYSLYNSTSVTVAAKAKDATTNVGHLLYNLNDEKDSSSALVWNKVDNGNITVENLAQGLNTLKIKAADEAGNETSEVAISFFVDSLAPAEPALKSVDSDSDESLMADFAAQNKQKLVNGKEDVTFTLGAADDTSGGENSYSGIASVELTKIGNKTLSKAISGTFVSKESGKQVYSITIPANELASGSANVTVKDRAGNATTLGMFNFLLDNKAPAVSMSSPAGDVNKTISLNASATDNQEIDGTTLKLEYSLDKAAWTELSSVNAGSEYKAVISDSVISVTGFDTTKFADKSTVYVRAVISDKAKNEGKSEAAALSINQDSDRPVVKIDNLARLGDGTFILKYGTNAQITGTLSDDDSTTSAVVKEFVISESPYNGSGSVENLAKKFDPTTGDFTFEPEHTEDGEKTLYFYIKDNGGNEFYTTASTGADSSGNTTYLKKPKLYLKTEPLEDSLATAPFTYKSDSNSPTVTAGKGVLYSDNAGEKVAKDANGEDFDFARSNSTLNTSFVAGGSERRFVKFQFEANDASGIEGMTLELFDEANNSVLKLKTPEISASGFTTSGTIKQKQNDKTNETDPTTSIWTTEIIDLEGKTTAQYTAKIVPYDKAGLAGNGSYSFFIDNAAPEIVIRSPISGKEVTGTVSIVGTATDTGSSGTANIQWLIPKKDFVTVANTKTDTEKLEYLKSLNWNGGEDALAATATLTSWQFDFDGKNDDVISDPANFIFKGGNPTLDVYDSGVFATNITDGIYALPVYFMATDAIGNYSIYTEYALRHNPDGDKPKLDFLYPTVSDYGKDKDGKDLEYVVLGGTIRATGSAVIPSGTTTVRSVYYQIAGEEGSFSDSDKIAASTNYKYTVLTAYDVVKEITGTDYSSTSRTIDDSMLKKFGFSTKEEMNAWWGIKANGTAAWNIILNERGELNPKTNGSTTNIKIRTCGINAEGKFGAWTSGDNVISIHIDDKAPVINSIVKQYKDEITSNPAELPAYTASQNYVSDMFLRGQWYLEVTLLDETAVTSYSVQKDTSTLTAGREYFVQSNVEDKSIKNKKGYRLYIPIDKNSDSVSYTITANDAEHTATQTFSFKLDNTAPTLENLTGNGQDLAPNGIIEDSNYVYTVGGKSEDSGSGVERVLFYFMRKSGTTKTTIANEVLLDPMITTGTDDSKIKLSTLTELPVKQGDDTFYLYAKEQTSSATKDTFTLTSADSHIRTGGLIYIDGLYRKITKIDGTTATFEPAMSEAKASVTAYFPIAQVIDNTATEKVKSNSANPFTFESGDDGDGMPETFSKTGTTWTWDATIHSYNMPDGPVTLVMLAFDAAGNVNGTSFNLTIANNAPRLAKVWLGTDLNGDGKYTSDSTLEEIVEYNILNAEGIEQKTYTLDFTETVSDKDSTLKYPAGKFTIKNGLAVIPEFTGGNGTIGMIPKLDATDANATTGTVKEASASDTTSTTKEKTLGDSAGKFSAQKLTANSKNNSVYGFVMDNKELGSDTEEKRISFTFWDKTEETTQGTDSQYSVLYVKNFVLEQKDSKPPVVRVNPFYWNSASSNSLYENSLKNGHIELEEDLPDTFKNSESASKDRDPKVSGKIVFTGTAYDNHGLSSISFSYGSLSNVVGATYDATNKKWSEKGTLSTDGYEFKVYDVIPKDANFKTDTAYFNQSGHKIYWTLAIDTENTNVISTIAAADIRLTVLATDSNKNKTNATPATTVDDDASYNKPVYKTDVVPYIAGIKTNLSSLKKNNSSVYDRTALGHYPVSSSETIYVYGFNINGGSLKDSSSNTTSLTKIDDATTQKLKWYCSEYAPSGSVYKTESIAKFKSGKISVIVKDISSLNNENADNARGNYGEENSTIIGKYSIYQNYYNRQPNNDSNNRLTDDVILDVWEFNSTAARPISGLITDPVMKISPTSGMIGFAFTNGPLYFSMPGTVRGNVRNGNSAGEYSYFYWQGSYDFMSSVALAYDSTGHTYGASAGGDINSSDADRFSFMTDRWGVSGAATGGSYAGNNALRLEAIAQYGDSSGNGPDTLNFNKNRVKSPSYATARSSASTNIYLAYYDDLNEEIRFRYGNLSDNSSKTNFGNFNDAYKSNAVSNQNNLNYGRYSTKYVQVIADADGNCLGNAGEYVSIGVIPAGSTNGQPDSDIVVMVWYDSINNKLKYTYNTKPTAGTTGKNKTNWNDAITLLSEAGEYCQLAVDAAGGIHIAAYDGSNADLKYVYIDKYDNAENAKSCTVDSYGILGQNITIDVAYNGTYYEPHIGYYALSSTKPKYARLTSAEISDGVKEDAYTGVWECSIVPTSSRAFQDRINVGVWKDSSGKIKESTKGTSSADQYWGKCYGNGTSNTVLGYAIKKSSSEGYIETAQMR